MWKILQKIEKSQRKSKTEKQIKAARKISAKIVLETFAPPGENIVVESFNLKPSF